MLMTRILYVTLTLVMLALNGAALWALPEQTGSPIVQTALVVNAVTWPIALMVAYRIGQVTGVAYLRKRRAALSAARIAKAKHHGA